MQLKGLIGSIIILSSVHASAGFFKKDFKQELEKQFKGASSLIENLRNLDLQKSPGPLVEIQTRSNAVAFRYIQADQAGLSLCSGLLPKQAQNQLPDYNGKLQVQPISQKIFAAAPSREACIADQNAYYETLAKKIPVENRADIADQLADLFSETTRLELEKKLYMTNEQTELHSLMLSLTGYDSYTGRGSYMLKLNIINQKKMTCYSVITYQLKKEESESGRPVVYPVIDINLPTCGTGRF